MMTSKELEIAEKQIATLIIITYGYTLEHKQIWKSLNLLHYCKSTTHGQSFAHSD